MSVVLKPEDIQIVEITRGDDTKEYQLERREATGDQRDPWTWKSMGVDHNYMLLDDAKKAKNNLTKHAIISRKVVG